MRKVLIRVTDDDILFGQARTSQQCPIARAARRRLKGELKVGPWDIYFTGSPEYIRLPQRARYFVQDFDHFSPVEPINFYITVPEALVKS